MTDINVGLAGLPRDENYVPLQATFKHVVSGTQTVVTAGTAVQLVATPTQAKRLDVTGGYGNTDIVTIGGSGVVGAQTGRKGVPLAAGNTYTFTITDVSQVWVDAVHSGDTISFNYFY